MHKPKNVRIRGMLTRQWGNKEREKPNKKKPARGQTSDKRMCCQTQPHETHHLIAQDNG